MIFGALAQHRTAMQAAKAEVKIAKWRYEAHQAQAIACMRHNATWRPTAIPAVQKSTQTPEKSPPDAL